MKSQYIGGLPKKGGSWKVCEFKRVLGKKEGVVFLRGGGGGGVCGGGGGG